MATEQEARQAEAMYATMLENLDTVVGIGVVPLDPPDSGFAVGIYVQIADAASAPDGNADIPATLTIENNGVRSIVPTRLIQFSPSFLQ